MSIILRFVGSGGYPILAEQFIEFSSHRVFQTSDIGCLNTTTRNPYITLIDAVCPQYSKQQFISLLGNCRAPVFARLFFLQLEPH